MRTAASRAVVLPRTPWGWRALWACPGKQSMQIQRSGQAASQVGGRVWGYGHMKRKLPLAPALPRHVRGNLGGSLHFSYLAPLC